VSGPSKSSRIALDRSRRAGHPQEVSERPVDGVGQVEAARILACHRWTVAEYVRAGRLRSAGKNVRRGLWRADVEALASDVYRWQDHRDDEEPYWIVGERAAETLGVNRNRVRQLVAAHRIPYVRHSDGTYLFRREQLQVVAQARDVNWARYQGRRRRTSGALGTINSP
jgi:excisionase family DNA binding protein